MLGAARRRGISPACPSQPSANATVPSGPLCVPRRGPPRWCQSGTMSVMALNIRLTETEDAALTELATIEGSARTTPSAAPSSTAHMHRPPPRRNVPTTWGRQHHRGLVDRLAQQRNPRYLDVEDLLHIIELEDLGPVSDLGLLDSASADRPRRPSASMPTPHSRRRRRPCSTRSSGTTPSSTAKAAGRLATVAFLWINGHVLLAPRRRLRPRDRHRREAPLHRRNRSRTRLLDHTQKPG